MIEVPAYLNSYANNVNVRKNLINFSLRCNCGCESFWLLKNTYTDEENKQIEEFVVSMIRKSDGIQYMGMMFLTKCRVNTLNHQQIKHNRMPDDIIKEYQSKHIEKRNCKY